MKTLPTEIKEADKPFYTINDLSAFGISRSTWYALAKEGRITFRKFGGRTVVLKADLNAFLSTLPAARNVA